MSAFPKYDYELLKWVQINRIDFLDVFFYWISSSTFIVSIITLGIIGWLYITKKPKPFNIKYYSLLLIIIASSFISLFLKYTVKRPRPFITNPDIIQLSETSNFSFPSGHTTIAFTLAFGMLFISFKKIYLLPVFCWAFLVAYSRMILGAHYLTDILTAIIISFMLSLLIKPISTKWTVKKT
ncbi:hypothetical protein CW731_02845 [Polaribacter sp. ALD11]|uniref:phosphatase PAP2 family protein n=1 Tax=Polaribacter sp. ALD11 TaxID=2058137 RepID=UPI000C31AA1D|nr:phosphatase PAP2 family protein [Polaribacter sp. ALD11]AUC84299.1 hypothetical protein CW731_02845 [Polaribacter sp. ALD11]